MSRSNTKIMTSEAIKLKYQKADIDKDEISQKVFVVTNLHCQLNYILNHLGDWKVTFLGDSVW